MVNKADFAAANPNPGVDLLIQELVSKYPMQIFSSLAQMGGVDFSLPSKIALELLPKEPFDGSSKLSRLVTLLPTFKNLSPEIIKMLEAGGKGGLSKEQSNGGKENPGASKPALEKTGSEKSIPNKAAPFSQAKGERDMNLAKTLPQGLKPQEKPTVGLSVSAMLSTIKEVLSILSYFANHVNTLKPESFEAFQKMMKPLMDQLVRPVKKAQEGELESQNREVSGQERSEKTLPKGKSLPLPSDVRQKPEKAVNSHKIDRSPNHGDRLDRETRAPSSTQRASEAGKSNPNQPQSSQNFKSGEGESKPFALPVPAERIAIPAAPFSFQHPISTAPRGTKKKPKDPREEEDEQFKDEEDPFQKK
jgi:hypothetical protein